MKTLRVISLFLCVIMAAAALAGAVFAAGGYQYKLFDPALDSKKTPVEVPDGSVYGQRVILNAPFTAVTFCLPTWNGTDSQCTVGAFKWQGDFDSTVKAGALHEMRIDPMRDCATNVLNFGETLPAGEYLFAIYDTVNKVGIWRYPMTKSHGFAYMDGAESECDLEITVYFTEKTDDPVTACESQMKVDGTKKAPAEYVIPDDDILKVRNAYPDTWVATDALGRELPTNAQTGDVREGKYVGLFYWSWHNDLASSEPLNVNEFILEHPESQNDYNYPGWPKTSTAYFWDEPLYGFYRTTDRWVIRRHAELLANAGVDVIFFDNTNGTFTWRSSYRVIFDVFDEARKNGVNTPKISFLLPFDASSTNTKTQLELLYTDIYRQEKYHDLWFYWDGKPLLMAGNNSLDSTPLDKEIRKFFTFRAGQPLYDAGDGAVKQWGWLSRNPQARYYKSAKDLTNKNVEQMTVGVAQNSSTSIVCTAMNGENIFGRSYTHKDGFAHYSEENHSLYGYNFAEQWEYALEVDPQFIFVTGWNEWTAGRYESWGGVANAFPDEFNDEYSRDIEPTKGELKDNYYYQLVSYIRKFKGTNAIPVPTAEKTVDIKSDVSQWDDVGPYYIAYPGNTFDRDSKGYGSTYYTDNSGRNDIKGAKLSRDNENLYILIECENEITGDGTPDFMNVYLDTAQNGLDGWESFDYVIKDASGGKVGVYRFTGSSDDAEKAGEGEYTVSGKYVQIKVKRSDIGITGTDYTVNFKITDGVTAGGDIMNFYTKGDAAPGGRFKYSYTVSGGVPAQEGTKAETESDAGEMTDTADAQTETADAQTETATETASEPGQKGGAGKYVIIGACVVIAVTVAVVAAIVVKKRK